MTTRIDLLFQDVRAMEIRCWFDGLIVEEVNESFLNNAPSRPSQMIEPGNKVYAIKSSGWNGFIVGGIMRIQEDEAEFFAPSKLLPT
jgi:hypothetical protein